MEKKINRTYELFGMLNQNVSGVSWSFVMGNKKWTLNQILYYQKTFQVPPNSDGSVHSFGLGLKDFDKKTLDNHINVCKSISTSPDKDELKFPILLFLNDEGIKKVYNDKSKYEKHLENNKYLFSFWGEYIKLLRSINSVTEDTFGKLLISLKDKLGGIKPYYYPLNNINNGNSGCCRIKKPTHDNRNLYELIKDSGVTSIIDVKDGDLQITHGFGKSCYSYNKIPFLDLNPLERITTLISIDFGMKYSGMLKDKKSKPSKDQITNSINLNYINGISSTLARDKTFTRNSGTKCKFLKQEGLVSVSFIEVLNYFRDSSNRNKIVHDMTIGLFSKHIKGSNINNLMKNLGLCLECDVPELHVLSVLDVDNFLSHLSLNNGISSQQLKRLYLNYGTRFLNGTGSNFYKIDTFTLLLFIRYYFNLKEHDFGERKIRKNVSSEIDVVIKSLNVYFGRKENSLYRKKNWLLNYDGSISKLIDYRNRIVPQELYIDSSLMSPIMYSKDEIKDIIFSHFFTY
jgi:hypothetical protein